MVKEDLVSFYKRRLAQLEVKKLRMIQRWAFHSNMVSLVDVSLAVCP